MSSTYTNTTFIFAGALTILVGPGCKYYTSAVTYPTAALPCWTVVLTKRDTSGGGSTPTYTIYSTTLTMVNPAA
jgi:hypothetical protein